MDASTFPKLMSGRLWRAAGNSRSNASILTAKARIVIPKGKSAICKRARRVGAPFTSIALPTAEVVARFRADRDQEYREFEVQCRDFLAEIAKETNADNLTFAALEENEHDVQKLHTWLEKIRARDFFSALQTRAAADALASCEKALHGFAEAIYAREGLQERAEGESGHSSSPHDLFGKTGI